MNIAMHGKDEHVGDNDDYDHHDLAMTFLTLSDDDDEYCDDAGDDDNDNYDVLK